MAAPWRDKEPFASIKKAHENMTSGEYGYTELNMALHEMDDLNACIVDLEKQLDRTVKESLTVAPGVALVDGERQEMYGPPEETFERIAALWTAYFWHREPSLSGGFADIEPAEVADLMMLLKIARDMGPGYCEDNMLDVQGYAEIKARLTKGGE